MYQYQPQFAPNEILIYLRKSRSDDPLLSVEEVLAKHEFMLDDWAVKHLGEKVPEDNKYREVVSGETIADRPEIQKVLRMAESPRYKAILIVEIQRLSRGDLEDAGRLIKLLRFTNTRVITPQKIYDLENDYDRDFFERELKRGNEYLEYTKKIMSAGRILSVSQGNFIGSIAPYGYEKITVTEGKRKVPTLKIKPDEANVVRMIFDMYVNQNMGFAVIARQLDKLGIKPGKGAHWSVATLRDLIANDHYIGKVRWNWRKTVTVVENGEILHPRPKMKEYLIFDGKHEAIITEDLFYAAQAKKGQNPRTKAALKIRNPLAGLIYCQCGHAMVFRIYKNPDGSERNAPRVLCIDQAHCHTGSCLYDDMVGHVSGILERSIRDFQVQLQKCSGESVALHAEMIRSLETKLQKLDEKELAQWEAQADPDPAKRMPHHIFQRLNDKLAKERQETLNALQEARASAPKQEEYVEKIMRFQKALDSLRDPEADPQEQNRLLKACIKKIIYHRDQPYRLVSADNKDLKSGANWSDPQIELNVELKI